MLTRDDFLVTDFLNREHVTDRAAAARLFNAALGKPASQSSFDAGCSRPDGAQGLVNGDYEQSFGIHTEAEDRPWWSLDLLEVLPIEAIVVHNRQDMCQERARSLKIEISKDNNDWRNVHQGLCYFGSAQTGSPLIISLMGQEWARYVRLSLDERQCLHLSQCEVLVSWKKYNFVSIRRGHGLDCLMFGEVPGRTKHECYDLVTSDQDYSGPLLGLSLNENGAFGNCAIQICNAVALAKRLNLRFIKLSENDRSELIRLKARVETQDITFLAPGESLPSGGVFLHGSFFDFSFISRAVGQISMEQTHQTFKHYVKRVFNVLPEKFVVKPADELHIHIRSGDIFRNWVNPYYVQPPLSFYTGVIQRMVGLGSIDRVKLVFENKLNPVIEPLESFLESLGLPYTTQSGTVGEDIEALVNARLMLFGLGSFGPAVCQLSDEIDLVMYFGCGDNPWYHSIPSVKKAVEVLDRAGAYMKPGDWHNTPEQRALMVNYPVENLKFPWS